VHRGDGVTAGRKVPGRLKGASLQRDTLKRHVHPLGLDVASR